MTIATGGGTPSKGQLTLGSSALFSVPTKKSLTYTSAGGKLTINNDGILEIWGDLILGNGFTLTLNGNAQLIIHGNLTDNGTGGAKINAFGTSSITVGGSLSLTGGEIAKDPGATIIASSCSCSCGGNGCNNVLPVEILFFEAHAQKDRIELNWATASELNFDYFSIERSWEGLDFHEIEQIKGHGTSQERHDYSFDDNFPIIGRSYYRLTAVDLDGYMETFDLATVNYKGVKSAWILPNPSIDGKLNVVLTFTPSEELGLTILDSKGIEITTLKIYEQYSSLKLDLDPGTYFVKIIASDFSKVIRVAVR